MNRSSFARPSRFPGALAMQQLLGGATVADRLLQASQRLAEELSVGVSECRRFFVVPDHELSFRDSICEMWSR